MDTEKVNQFCAAVQEAKKRVVQCSRCFVWKEHDKPCSFCDAQKRDQGVVCVVQTWHDVLAIEKTGGYTGVYHVLGGVICPLDGIGPEDLTIDHLVKRVEQHDVQEIILAMNQTPEGEATATYVAHKLKATAVKVSCLARGVPVGSSLEYMDRLTLYKALTERRPF